MSASAASPAAASASAAATPSSAAASASVAAASNPARDVDTVLLTSLALERAEWSPSLLVGDDAAGAISSFVGTTRNSFQGKRVLQLSYEAYEAMALKQMRTLVSRMRSQWPTLVRCAVLHRLGVVVVGEASVLLCASSPHRRDAIDAVSWAIDELKRTVVVWKKEHYDDGSTWKENAEWRQQQEAIRLATGGKPNVPHEPPAAQASSASEAATPAAQQEKPV